MQHLQWYDFMRMFTMTISLAALWVAGARAVKQWDDYTPRLREFFWVMSAFLFLAFESSLEQILMDAGWGARTLLALLICLAALRAMCRKGGYLRSEGHTKD